MKRAAFAATVFLMFVATGAFAVTGPFTTRVAFTTDRDGNSEIYTVNANGSVAIRLTNNTSTDTHATYSRDGRKIAFMSNRDGNNEIYVMNADGSGQTRLTNNPASDSQPAFSPDGAQLVFVSNRGGNFDLFSLFVDGTGPVNQLTNHPASDTDPSFSPAGNKIVFTSNRDGVNAQIYTMFSNGASQTRLTNTGLLEVHPRFSRDGEKITFARHVLDVTGFKLQIEAMNADGTNESVLTSSGANSNPEFAADDKRIFFNSNRDGNNELYSMAVDGSNEVRLTGNTFNDIAPSVQSQFEVETVGVYRPTTGQWSLSTANAAGALAMTVSFGQPGDIPVTGNWDGDSRTDIGVFRFGTFHLALLKGIGGHTFLQELAPIPFGQAGDLPVAGDWNGDGTDDVGVFRPGAIGGTGKFMLRQPLNFSPPFNPTVLTIQFDYGTNGDLPVAGDWDGDGDDTPGVYRPTDPGTFLLTNSLSNTVDINFTFGAGNDRPLAGDWLGAGKDGVGVLLTSQVMILTPDLSKGLLGFPFGQPGDIPVAGSWLP